MKHNNLPPLLDIQKKSADPVFGSAMDSLDLPDVEPLADLFLEPTPILPTDVHNVSVDPNLPMPAKALQQALREILYPHETDLEPLTLPWSNELLN